MRIVFLVAIAALLNGCALAGAAMLAQMQPGMGCTNPGTAGCQPASYPSANSPQAAYPSAAWPQASPPQGSPPPPGNLPPGNPLAATLLQSQPVALLHQAAALFAVTASPWRNPAAAEQPGGAIPPASAAPPCRAQPGSGPCALAGAPAPQSNAPPRGP